MPHKGNEEKRVNYDYGEREICTTPMKEMLVKQDFWIQESLSFWKMFLRASDLNVEKE